MIGFETRNGCIGALAGAVRGWQFSGVRMGRRERVLALLTLGGGLLGVRWSKSWG